MIEKNNQYLGLEAGPPISWARVFFCNCCLSSVVWSSPTFVLKSTRGLLLTFIIVPPSLQAIYLSLSLPVAFHVNQNRRLRLSDWAHGYHRLSPTCRECSYVSLVKICSFDVAHVVSHLVVVHCCTRPLCWNDAEIINTKSQCNDTKIIEMGN